MAESVVYCNVVMNLDGFNISNNRPSFLLGQLGLLGLIKLIYSEELYLLKWKVIYLKLKWGFNRILSIYSASKFKGTWKDPHITYQKDNNFNLFNLW